MTSIRIQPQRYLLLILLFLTCACAAQRHHVHGGCFVVRDKNKHQYNKQHPAFTIPRGGDVDELMDEVTETIQDAVVDWMGLGPWLQKHTLLIIKAIISSFFVAQILAYCGVIGDKGEGLLEWAEDNKSRMHVKLRKLFRMIRIRLEKMVTGFANLPDRAQFVTCVSVGASVFPLTIKTVVLTSAVTFVGFVFAEALHHLGALGDVGEDIQEWIEDTEASALKSFKRWMNERRKIMRKQLNLEELIKTVWKSLGNDRVFWAGMSVGAIASVVLDKEKTTQGLVVDEDKLIK